jgi:hypothetical protein
MKLSRDSVLFITLDSCRYDTFATTTLPNMKRIAPLHCAQAPSYFTYGSHASMFVGFTPGINHSLRSFLNPKFTKVFKLSESGSPNEAPAYTLSGPTIIEGFRRLGFKTIGTGAVNWFNPETETGLTFTSQFAEFLYVGGTGDIERQVRFLEDQIDQQPGDVFAFLNAGETHVPYYHRGADWDLGDNPCVPFQQVDRSADCRARQSACCVFIDQQIGPLLDRFSESTILITSDHGDCWGEDGLWEHGVSHPATLAVPLVLKIRGEPI